MFLIYISQQLTIYCGIFLVVAGLIGNGTNIWIFSTVRNYRTTPCTFYFLINSIHNLIFSTVILISRIVTTGYGVDLTRTSLAWCKIRAYLLAILSLISFTTLCLPSIDQFLLTSRSVHLRSLSNIKWAHRIVFIVIFVSGLHSVPTLIYDEIVSVTQTCLNINTVYAIYISIYILTVSCIIPVVIMIIFGYLTYRNIHQTRVLAEQQVDRQLIRMTLMQVILVVICIGPYGINNAYNLITSGIRKAPDQLEKESLLSTIGILLIYVNYIGNFYIFLFSSSRFRREIIDRILFWRKRPNQINPVQLPRRASLTIKTGNK